MNEVGTPSVSWVLDLDGVVWLSDELVPGSAEAVARLRRAGERVVFVTNNSSATQTEYLEKLERLGIPTNHGDLVTSAQAAATLVEPGETALVCGGPGVVEALSARGVTVVPNGLADAVVVGWHRDFDFERLDAAFQAVKGGARLIGTNDDPTYPTPAGTVPGGGAIVASVSYATGVEPVFAGKPHPPIAGLLADKASDVTMLVGDRLATDGLLAHRLGVPFALVLSGVTVRVDPDDRAPDLVAADLAALVAQEYGAP